MTTRHKIIAICFTVLVVAIIWRSPNPVNQAASSTTDGFAAGERGLVSKGTATVDGHVLKVEFARDEAAWEQGMMYRKTWGNLDGMLFIFPAERPQSFWMKNTYLPLDIIFIDHAGNVVSIADHAEPLSTNNIDSGGPAQFVLEIPAGKAAEYGVKIGDMITWDMP